MIDDTVKPAKSTLTITTNEGVDVTEGVRALYDLVISSMDWGSNFLTAEDAGEVVRVAQACGFLMPEEAARAFEAYARDSAHGNTVRCAVCGDTVVYAYAGQVNYDYTLMIESTQRVSSWVHGRWQREVRLGSSVAQLVVRITEADHPVQLWADA